MCLKSRSPGGHCGSEIIGYGLGQGNGNDEQERKPKDILHMNEQF